MPNLACAYLYVSSPTFYLLDRRPPPLEAIM